MAEGASPFPWTAAADVANNTMNAIYGNWQSNKAYKRSLHMMDLQNEYNKPINQIKRLREANLSPSLVYGQGASTMSTSATPPPAPMSGAQPFAHIAESSLADSQRRNIDQDTIAKEVDNIYRAYEHESTIQKNLSQVKLNFSTAHLTEQQQKNLIKEGLEIDEKIKNWQQRTATDKALEEKTYAEALESWQKQIGISLDNQQKGEMLKILKAQAPALIANPYLVNGKLKSESDLNAQIALSKEFENGVSKALQDDKIFTGKMELAARHDKAARDSAVDRLMNPYNPDGTLNYRNCTVMLGQQVFGHIGVGANVVSALK